MKIKLKFTEEHIALIKALKFERIDFEEILKSFSQYDNIVKFTDDNGVQIEGRLSDVLNKYHISVDSIYGIDNYNLWGGTYIWEQVAYIIGVYDKILPGTQEDPDGPKYPPEIMEHMKDLVSFMITNIQNIIELLLQFCTEGIQPNVVYWCYDNQKIWHKE